MQLNELKSLLSENADRHFRIRLPDGDAIPLSFHVKFLLRPRPNLLKP